MPLLIVLFVSDMGDIVQKEDALPIPLDYVDARIFNKVGFILAFVFIIMLCMYSS